MNLNLYNFDSVITTIDSSAEKITEKEFKQTPTLQELTINLQPYNRPDHFTLHIFKNHTSVVYRLELNTVKLYYKTTTKPLQQIIDHLRTYFVVYT